MERSNFLSTHLEGEIMAIVTVGVDLAKNVFAVHGVDESGKAVLMRPSTSRVACEDRWVVAPDVFWKARGGDVWCTAASVACVFKKFSGWLPDGRPLVHNFALKGCWRAPRKKGSEQNFGCVWLRFGEWVVLNFDLTPFFATIFR
jgi:hypothetical protein